MKYNLICSEDQSEVKVPNLPFVVVLPNREAYETDCIMGLMCLIVDRRYQDNEDSNDGWIFRVLFARKVAMQMILQQKNVVVYDDNKGIIKNNYAVTVNDPDYEEDEEGDEIPGEPFKLNVTNEKKFLKGLMELNIITVLEREDSKQFKENGVVCSQCSHCIDGKCEAYCGYSTDGNCYSATKYDIGEKARLEYIDVNSQEY